MNARDLGTFAEDLGVGERLAALVPPEVIAIAESAIRSCDDAARMARSGFDAVLVGEMLVKSDDPTAIVRQLASLERGRRSQAGTPPWTPCVFGRTGLEVSVAGLGCGGHSRLGQSYGSSVDDSVRLVRRAIDLGITYIDTADAYGTEAIVGQAVAGDRDQRRHLHEGLAARPRRQCCSMLRVCAAAVQESLRKLDTDWIDVYHLHGVGADEYRECVARARSRAPTAARRGMPSAYLAVSERFACRSRSHDVATSRSPTTAGT